jgi:hypothetical protein
MSRMSKDKQQKLLLVIGATLGLALVLWFVLIGPLRAKLGSLAKAVAEAQAKVSQGQRSLAAAPQLTNELASSLAQLRKEEAVMASGDLYEWMIQTMNRFKALHAVEIPQISRDNPAEVGMLPKFPYRAASFTLRGTALYHELGRFIADLENAFPSMQVQNLQLTPLGSTKSEESERLQFSMDLLTLVKPVTP